jgi:hypothetical protein
MSNLIENLSKDDAMTLLISEEGMTFKEASAYWVDNRPERGTGFAARFYLALETEWMSSEEFDAFLEGESKNTIAHKSHFDAIRVLANTIRENLTDEVEEEESEEGMAADVAANG